jgi:hypothetical protein
MIQTNNITSEQTYTKICTLKKVGYWSATLSTIFGIAYVIAEMGNMLGYPSEPWGLATRMIPSLFLAPCFVVLMVAIFHYSPEEKKLWSHAGLAFALIYAVLVSIVYFVQTTFMVPLHLQGEAQNAALLIFDMGSFMFAIDVLGYGFMSLATLFIAPLFKGKLRWILIANGFLAPIVPLEMIFPNLLFVAALWIITFPTSTIMLARKFKSLKALS